MFIGEEELLCILNNFNEGIFIGAANGDILWCNNTGAKMFGYTLEEITSCNIRDLVPATESYNLKDQFTQNGQFPNNYRFHLNMKRDKTLINTEINSKIIKINGQEHLLSFVREAGQTAHAGPASPNFNTLSVFHKNNLMSEKRFMLTIYDSAVRDKIPVPLIKVEYVESCMRKLTYHIRNGIKLESYDTLNRLEQRLPQGCSFLRCHQSYIVNLRCVRLDECLKIFITRNNAWIPITKRKYTKIRKAYYTYKILMDQSV